MLSNTNIELNEAQLITEIVVGKYNDLLLENSVEDLVDMLHDEKHLLKNRQEHILIIDSLKHDSDVYSKLVVLLTKHVIRSAVKQLPLLVLANIGAELLVGRGYKNRMRIATDIIRLLEVVGAFVITTITNRDGHDERIINSKYLLTKATKEELLVRSYNRTIGDIPREASSRVAGHRKKITASNDHMLYILDKLNNVGYTLEPRVWEKYKYDLAAYRFDDMNTQEMMISEGEKLLGKTFYFSHVFGSDNGRVYCEGDLFTLHGGALNYAFKFADKRYLSARGMERLEEKVAELEAELTAGKCGMKVKVEYYSLSLDLIDAKAGKPVGTILHVDAKLSGLQHQCIATRNRSEAVYCGLLDTVEDGYGHIKSMLSNSSELSRDMVKKAYNPYQYGAGAIATVKPVLEAGGHLDFVEWELAYKKAFPNASRLRSFLLSTAKNYNSEVFSYTTPSGFHATITALGTETDHVVTCYGKLKYERKEIDKKHMGVKLVAAFSHMLDSSLVHYVASKSNFDLHVIHDSFGSHPNDTDRVGTLYIHGMQENLVSPVLKNFIGYIVGDRVAEANVSRMLSNTLTPTDIVGGLY